MTPSLAASAGTAAAEPPESRAMLQAMSAYLATQMGERALADALAAVREAGDEAPGELICPPGLGPAVRALAAWQDQVASSG